MDEKGKIYSRNPGLSLEAADQQLPLISSANTRNLNARGPDASIHGQGKGDKEKFIRERRISMRFQQKGWLLRLLAFPTPFVVSLLALYANNKSNDKKN